MATEKTFWWYWLGGLGLLALMGATNPMLGTPVAPDGILDHQAASTAAMVDAIQQSWADRGVMPLARISMAIDLLFIGVYTRGAVAGAQIFRGNHNVLIRRLGALILAAAAVFCIGDYTETISQFVEAMTFRGSDLLSAIHSTARPIKHVAFLVTLVGLPTALILRRITAKSG